MDEVTGNEIIQAPSAMLAHYLKKNERKIELSLSGALPVDKFLQVSLNTIRGNDKLEKSTPDSILSSLLQAAEIRLFPGSTLGHAYLVPYWSNKVGAFICTYILGYKGMIALCHRSTKILKVEAQTVHEGDEFTVSYGQGGGLRHEPDAWGERSIGNCLGAYAIAHLTNGTFLFERMSKAELEAIRGRSKSGNNGPWMTDRIAMYCKTAVRKLARWLPLEPCDQEAIADDEARDLGFAQARDVEAEPVESPADELNALMDAQETASVEADAEDAEGPVLSAAQEGLLSEWMSSPEIDTGRVVEYVTVAFGATHITDIDDAQAADLLTMLESGDFAPIDE